MSPGTQGGEFVSPAKAVIERAQSKVTEIPSRFRFFIFHLLGLRFVLLVLLNTQDEACFENRASRG